MLGPAIHPSYRTVESEHFLMVLDRPDRQADRLLGFAEATRSMLDSLLSSVADLRVNGKLLVVALRNVDDYYRYVSQFYPEGTFGGSGGLQIRDPYHHIALNALDWMQVDFILAHELTHAALAHLNMPLWVEEGLAQMMEHDATGSSRFLIDPEQKRRHHRYWSKHGLDEFWSGDGFSTPGECNR